MLTNSTKLLENAKENKSVIFHFNINNLEFTKYILEEANILNKPVILGVSESAAKYMGGYKTVSSMVKALIEELNIKIDVVLHLDHGRSITACEEAIDAGFTSIMYDGSRLSIEENIKNTKYLTNKYKKQNISIEGELGAIGTRENEIAYTKVEDAIKYYKETDIDSLAIAVGNVHGVYKGKPNINIKLIKEISDKLNIPLVLHGGSGISIETFKESIKNGISKININTEIQITWTNEVRKYLEENKEEYDPRKIISSGEEKVKEVVRTYLNIA